MNLPLIAFKNLGRNKLRVGLTILGVAVALVAFITLRTTTAAWQVGVEASAADRIVTRHKVTFVMQVPLRYVETVRQVPGVTAATYANWFGARWPKKKDMFFQSLGVETDTFFDVYDEMKVEPDALARWKEDRSGVILGDLLAKEMGVKVGDKITLEGTIYPGLWDFTVAGTYQATRKSVDRRTFMFHWRFLNERARSKDMIGWVVSRVANGNESPKIARQIDSRFDIMDVQTLSQSEKQFNLSFLGAYSALFTAMDIVSFLILGILMLILGNTVAMSVRERTNEYGVLRALGFRPHHVATFVYSEAILMGLLAGVLSVVIAFPLVELGLGRFLEENVGTFFPYFRIPRTVLVGAIGIAGALGVLAAAIPAFLASRLSIVDALRKVD